MKTFFSLLFLISAFLIPSSLHAQQADSLLAFIKANKSRSSLYLVRNDTVISSLNENRLMPLASTMKIMVAIEFAKQAAFHVFDPEKKVPLNEIDKYYLPGTDGNAHPQWIKYEKANSHISDDSVSLLNVARGMILFSSNANTEYLMDLLGLHNINNNYGLMGIKDFTPVYYFVSALMLYQNPKNLKEEKVLKEIRSFSQRNYINACSMIHDQLKNKTEYKKLFRPQDLSVAMQKEWSNRLPESTTKSYAHIAQIINNRKIFSPETYQVLSKVLESIMENPANKQWLDHAGMKGGSTMFVLTKCIYATLKTGDKTALAYFFNDLNLSEEQKLEKWMNAFELNILSDRQFLNQLKDL